MVVPRRGGRRKSGAGSGKVGGHERLDLRVVWFDGAKVRIVLLQAIRLWGCHKFCRCGSEGGSVRTGSGL